MNKGQAVSASMAAIGLLGGFGLAHATANDEASVISACVGNYDVEDPHRGGVLRIPDPQLGGCEEDETPILWNVTGPTGATGPTGPTGAAGLNGANGNNGANGANGKDGARGPSGKSTARGPVIGMVQFEGAKAKTFPIYSYDMEVTQSGTTRKGGGSGSGKSTFSNPTVTLDPGKYGATLLAQVATGRQQTEATIWLCDLSAGTDMKTCMDTWTTEAFLRQYIIAEYDKAAYQGGPLTTVKIDMQRIRYTTRTFDDRGKVDKIETTWNIATNSENIN